MGQVNMNSQRVCSYLPMFLVSAAAMLEKDFCDNNGSSLKPQKSLY